MIRRCGERQYAGDFAVPYATSDTWPIWSRQMRVIANNGTTWRDDLTLIAIKEDVVYGG